MGASKQILKLHAVIRREGNRFTACVPLLPGAVSFGINLEDAKRNIREAAEGVIESYLEHGGEIPWRAEALPEDEPRDNDVLFEFSVDV
jgi:predicted RNase H-like HicB family nuclease